MLQRYPFSTKNWLFFVKICFYSQKNVRNRVFERLTFVLNLILTPKTLINSMHE